MKFAHVSHNSFIVETRENRREKVSNTFAPAQFHSKTCTVSDAVEEKDNAVNKTRNGGGGDNGRRNGLRRTGYRPGRWWDHGITEKGWRPVHEILGKLGNYIPTGDGANVDRKALQEGKLAAPPLIPTKARVPLAQWSADGLASCSHTNTP